MGELSEAGMGNDQGGCGGIRMCDNAAEVDGSVGLVGNASKSATIYVLGGTGSQEGMHQLMSVEKFDIPRAEDIKEKMSIHKWEDGQKMGPPRLGACGAYADGCLWVVGGWNGTSHDCSMEKFNPVTKTWTNSDEMRAPR